MQKSISVLTVVSGIDSDDVRPWGTPLRRWARRRHLEFADRPGGVRGPSTPGTRRGPQGLFVGPVGFEIARLRRRSAAADPSTVPGSPSKFGIRGPLRRFPGWPTAEARGRWWGGTARAFRRSRRLRGRTTWKVSDAAARCRGARSEDVFRDGRAGGGLIEDQPQTGPCRRTTIREDGPQGTPAMLRRARGRSASSHRPCLGNRVILSGNATMNESDRTGSNKEGHGWNFVKVRGATTVPNDGKNKVIPRKAGSSTCWGEDKATPRKA